MGIKMGRHYVKSACGSIGTIFGVVGGRDVPEKLATRFIGLD